MNVTSIILLAALTTLGFSQELSKAVINKKDGNSKQILLKRANKTALYYVDNVRDTTETAFPLTDIESIFFYRPSSFNKAIDLYNQDDFDLAKVEFTKCKEEFSSLKNIDGNYSKLSSYYEMECARRKGDLETLNTLLDAFRPDAIVNENALTQLSIYPFWEAVRNESWDRLILIADQWNKKKIPGSQRAQVAYCHALALEGKGDTDNALLKFNEAIALSELKEVEVIENACDKIISLILADEANKERFDLIGEKDAETKSRAYYQLREASSVAKLWDGMTAQTRPLNPKYASLLKLKAVGK